MTQPFNYEQLSPGIRNAVRWFHKWSYTTIDSGDGSNHAAGMEGAMECPMVAVSADPAHVCADAGDMYTDLKKALTTEQFKKLDIQAMFNPRDEVALILVTGDGLLSLR